MRTQRTILLAAILCSTIALGDTKMSVGDGNIDGRPLQAYELTWQQCSLQDGQWQSQGALTEELVIVGDHVIRHRQIADQSNGVRTRSDTYLDRRSLAPLRLEMEATKEGARLLYRVHELRDDGYTGVAIQGENRKELSGVISSRMLVGGAMGLPLSMMDFQDEPVEFPASMAGFDATYDVIAEWVEKEAFVFNGEEIEAWLIDVEWHHRESGDIYPPGPDASGGRYWVVADPPDGYPYVPRYQTDTYAVEFDQRVCPDVSP